MGWTRTSFSAAFVLLAACATASAPAPSAPSPDVPYYTLEATFGPNHTLDAVVRARLPAEIVNADPGFLLGQRFEVEVETSAPAKVIYDTANEPVPELNVITIDLDKPATEPVAITFRYHGPLNQDYEGVYTTATDGQIELRLDMMWFPIFKEINLQFAVDATFRGVPEDFVAVSQGEFVQDGGTVRVSRSMVDLDIPFVATRGLSKVTGAGVEIYAADFDWIVIDIMRRHAIASAAWFQEWFGPLPSGDVRVVILPKGSGGYARRGYIVTSEGREEAAQLEEIPEYGPARHIAHEFAHAWWSPADTLTEHRWLSESVAEYLSLRYVEHAFGLPAAHDLLERKRERAEAAQPLLGVGGPNRDSMYQRGPFLLFDLEEEIGRSKLDEILRRLGHNPPRVTEEFMAVLSEVAGPEAAAYFDAKMRGGPGPWQEKEAPTVAAPSGH